MTGTSHAAFIGPARPADGTVAVRFFTSAGELANCGHGTIAAQAVLLHRSGGDERRGGQRTGERILDTHAARRDLGYEVWFDQGIVELLGSEVAPDDLIAALGIARSHLHTAEDLAIASPGRPRLLVPVADRRVLDSVRPDERLAAECRRRGLLGCFVYVPPSPGHPAAARMFAPAIGVGEDIANANSVGCLAAYLLARHGIDSVEVEQGDALGRASTVFARAARTQSGIRTSVGGIAIIRGRRVP